MGGGGGEVLSIYNDLYGEAPLERVIFYRLQVYERVGIHKLRCIKGYVGKSVVSQRQLNK